MTHYTKKICGRYLTEVDLFYSEVHPSFLFLLFLHNPHNSFMSFGAFVH